MRPEYLARFQARAGLVPWNAEDLDGDALDPELCPVLHVATQLEEDTAITVRQGISLGIDRAPDLGVFLAQWELEEAEHGRALRATLAHRHYAVPVASPPSIARRRHLMARVPASAFGRLPQTPFLFCVLGAAAEYVATVLYSELATRAGHGAVASLLRAIARQEARHFAFFLAAARVRGEELSAFNGWTARRALDAIWEPIGVPTLGRRAWCQVFGSWLDDDHFRGRLLMMDRVVDTIPHLQGIRLMAGFLDEVAPLGATGSR